MTMQYMPLVGRMNRVDIRPLGKNHTMMMWDSIEQAGLIQYTYLLGVFDNATHEPIYFVSSEVNQAPSPGTGSHCLCEFDGEGHGNHGSSDQWSVADTFFQEAQRMAADRIVNREHAKA